MCHTRVKQYSNKLITNAKSTFDHIPCGFGVLMCECEDLSGCLLPLLLALLSMGSPMTPTLVMLPLWLLLWSVRLLRGTVLLLRWMGCRGSLTYWLSIN